MTELEKLVLWGTAIAAVVCLVGPATLWRITNEAAAWVLVILVLIWAL